MMKTLLPLLAFISSSALGQTFVKIDPKATYLRDSRPTVSATTLALGIDPGLREKMIRGESTLMMTIRSVGWFNRAIDNPNAHNVDNIAVAVFSVTGVLNPDHTQRYRVDQPLDAGTDFATFNTFEGNQPTDIDEDFAIGPEWLNVPVPPTASYLLFTPFDNGFWNNGDDFSMPGADPRGFGVELALNEIPETPEPASVIALTVGVAALVRRRCKTSTK